MIGLARPFVLQPNLVAKIRRGELQEISTPRLTTRSKKLDKELGPIIGVSYYEVQMKRISQGKQVEISKNAHKYLLKTAATHGLSALKKRRK